MKPYLALPGLLLLALIAAPARAADVMTARLVIGGAQFSPDALHVPADTKVKLVIRNDGAIPAEFESYDLSREIVVPGHTQVTAYIGPLKPGRYRFFNDFNHAMQGQVVVDGKPKN